MNYYIGTIEEQNGDMEYDTNILFTTPDDNDNPDEVVENIAATWRGWSPEDGEIELEDLYGMEGYWSGDSFIQAGRYKGISKKVFDACLSTGFIPDLTGMHTDYVEAIKKGKDNELERKTN